MPQFPVFATTAPSMPAGSHEMRDSFNDYDPPRSSPYTAPSVTPYLGLRSRLSQIWFNRWTILLVIVLARILIACASVNDNLSSSKAQALSACSSVESMGSVMASMPHYMSHGVNELTASGIEKSVNALMQTTTLAVTGVQEIVVFVINMMVSTYLCLITLAVSGSLHTVLGALDGAQNGLNDLTKSLGDDFADVTSKFQDAYGKIRDTLKGGVLGLGGGITLPDLNVNDDIDKLRKLQLPPGLSDDIKKLNDSIPTFTEVKNLTDNAIRFPFEQVKLLIDKSIGNYTFNRSVFPVPQKEQMSFCTGDDGIDDFFNNLSDIVSTGKKIFIAVLLVAAILVCIPMAYREIRRWHTMRERAKLVGGHEHDPMDVVYIVSRPYTATAGIKISNAFSSTRRQILTRWVVAYATSDAALFVLSLAIAGLFSCLCQYILLKSIEKEVPELTSQVAGFADKVVGKLNNASAQWAIGANKVIADTNSSINEDMFGWVNVSTTAINDTLNVFVDGTSKVLNDTFGGTILYDPITEVLNCLVLLKVAGFQKGLTWVHDNAHINIPLLPNDTFSSGAIASIAGDSPADESFLATPGDVAADKISNVVAKFVNAMTNQIRTETIISSCILGLYLVAVLCAIIRALTLWNGQERVRGEGGAAPTMTETPAVVNDFRTDNQDRYNRDRHDTERQNNFDNIPLGPITSYKSPAIQHEQGPAPRYSTAIEEKLLQERSNNPFADSKRNYSEHDFDTDNKV